MTATTPRRADARRNRERLLDAAREVFSTDGPGASLNEIARRAGVGPGTLYRHFPTRQALQAAVLRERIVALCAKADELCATTAPGEALAAWMRVFLAHARTDHGLAGSVLTETYEELGLDCHQMIQDAATRVLGRAQEAGAARADVSADDMVQLVTGIALVTTRHVPDPRRPERLLALALDALTAPPRG